MALNGDLMGVQIVAAISAIGTPGIVDGDSQAIIEAKASIYTAKLWKAIAGAIVAHIQTNAVVASSVAVTSVTGVTSGLTVSGPGVGTATGTIS